jgi:hypothetical protein
MCGLEISARPPCQAKQRGSASAPEMVVLRGEVERPPRMLLCLGEFTQQQRAASTMHGDRTREPAELRFVHDDHPR